MNFKSPYLALIGLAAELAGIFAVEPQQADWLRRGLIMTGYVLALLFVWRNRSTTPVAILGAGLVLNLVPMLANGGLMPVSPDRAARAGLTERFPGLVAGQAIPRTKDLLKDPGDIRLAPLSDTLVLPRRHGVASVGDLVILVGLVSTLSLPVLTGFHYLAQTAGVWPATRFGSVPRHGRRSPARE